jgi:hypothetical protein
VIGEKNPYLNWKDHSAHAPKKSIGVHPGDRFPDTKKSTIPALEVRVTTLDIQMLERVGLAPKLCQNSSENISETMLLSLNKSRW